MSKTRHLLGLSGGKDSAALAIYMRHNFPEIDMEYYFTDTGKELPEVYSFLGKLEGYLGKEIVRLNSDRDFDYWIELYDHFLPSPRQRWCTVNMKLKPFENWIKPTLNSGGQIFSYVAIRADEPERTGYVSKKKGITVKMPFRENEINKPDVKKILEESGVGYPDYYKWRSRSGCTFCFFQRKIEWVRLMQEHPDAFQEAVEYEKNAIEHDSPFTWTEGESLLELCKKERVEQIERDHAIKLQKEKMRIRSNPLLDDEDFDKNDIDELYGDDEGGGACLVCHK